MREAAQFTLSISAIEGEALETLRQLLSAEPVEIDTTNLNLEIEGLDPQPSGQLDVYLELPPLELRRSQLTIEVPPQLGTGQFAALEIAQLAIIDDISQVIGSIAMIIRPSEA